MQPRLLRDATVNHMTAIPLHSARYRFLGQLICCSIRGWVHIQCFWVCLVSEQATLSRMLQNIPCHAHYLQLMNHFWLTHSAHHHGHRKLKRWTINRHVEPRACSLSERLCIGFVQCVIDISPSSSRRLHDRRRCTF